MCGDPAAGADRRRGLDAEPAWQIYLAQIFLFVIYIAEIAYLAARRRNLARACRRRDSRKRSRAARAGRFHAERACSARGRVAVGNGSAMGCSALPNALCPCADPRPQAWAAWYEDAHSACAADLTPSAFEANNAGRNLRGRIMPAWKRTHAKAPEPKEDNEPH